MGRPAPKVAFRAKLTAPSGRAASQPVRTWQSSVDFAPAAVDRRDARAIGTGRQGIERLFAPLCRGTLISKSHAKQEQLAGICRRCGILMEALFQNAFVAGETVAVIFQPCHEIDAQRG